MKRLIVVILFFPFVLNASHFEQTANRVLNALYEANGNFIHDKPALVVTEDNDNAAFYLKRSNTIELSTRVYDVCTNFCEDSLSALAFVIGHELAHAYQDDLDIGSTSFLAYDHHHDAGIFIEESADIQGVFMAYLAGFETISILPDLIEQIYVEFGLSKELDGYPSLEERQKTTVKVMQMAEELIHLFEISNYLIGVGEYELAQASYEYILQWYKGEEIYNNLGVSYIQLALNFTEINYFPFAFPFELTWQTRMRKPLKSRGLSAMSEDEMLVFQSYLSKANTYFQTATKINPNNIESSINEICGLYLSGNFYEGDERLSECFTMNVNYEMEARLQTVKAIGLKLRGEIDKSDHMFQNIARQSTGLIKYQANYNCNQFDLEDSISQIDCSTIEFEDRNIDEIRLHRPNMDANFMALSSENDIAISIAQKSNSMVYTFKTNTEVFVIQRVFDHFPTLNNEPNLEKAIQLENGYLYHCHDQRSAIRFNEKGEIKDWVKYY